MKLSVQAIIGFIVGCILLLLGIALLTPEFSAPNNKMTPVLAAILTAMGVAIIGSSVLSGSSSVSGKSDKLFGLGIEASGGIGLFVITLIFISLLLDSSEPEKKSEPVNSIEAVNKTPVPVSNTLFGYVTFCDQCCSSHYPYLPFDQCPIRGAGESLNEQEAMAMAVSQCQYNGGLQNSCQLNLMRVR